MLRRTFLAGGVGVAAATLAVHEAQAAPYLWRFATLRGPDVEDYRHLPSRPVAAGGARALATALDPDWPRRLAKGAAPFADSGALEDFLVRTRTNAFLVLERGALVDERYANGYDAGRLCKSFSMSKSVLSALFGIAESEGLLSRADKVGDLIAGVLRDDVASLTLDQLLNGAAGFSYARGMLPWQDQPRMYYTRDVRGFVRRARLAKTPGASFTEEDISPLMLGVALEAALRRVDPVDTLSDFASRRLWRPLGAEADALWVVDRAKDGFEKVESGFVARARDLARFGQLLLDGGKAGETQVVPAAFAAECATPPLQGAPNLFTEGYLRNLWWGAFRPGAGRPDFYANGHFGQRIYICPDKALVLVRLGADRGGEDWTRLLGAVADSWPA